MSHRSHGLQPSGILIICCVCFHCAGKEQFDAALHHFWEERSAASGERVPTPIFVGSSLVEPWHFWREVWAWGGPEEVSKMKVGGWMGGQVGGQGRGVPSKSALPHRLGWLQLDLGC